MELLKGLDKNELERVERIIFVDIGDIKVHNEVLNELTHSALVCVQVKEYLRMLRCLVLYFAYFQKIPDDKKVFPLFFSAM